MVVMAAICAARPVDRQGWVQVASEPEYMECMRKQAPSEVQIGVGAGLFIFFREAQAVVITGLYVTLLTGG
ncbi:hypothetical protein GCM10010399_64440 [Dactylosporangium fulvum]